VITILSEYKNPEPPPTFTAFGSPVASWPNSTAEDGKTGIKVSNREMVSPRMDFFIVIQPNLAYSICQHPILGSNYRKFWVLSSSSEGNTHS
jgi:hypothetical protein